MSAMLRSGAMDVRVRNDPAVLEELAGEWRALWERDPAARLFQTPEYAQAAWWTELGADRRLDVVEVRRDGALAGLATITVDPDGTLRFLGNAAVTDYMGPIAAPEDRDGVADAVARALGGIAEWRTGELLGLASDSGWPEALARAAKAAGFVVEERQQDVCPRVALPGTYEEYLASLPGKLRHEIGRKARRLERETGGYTVRLSGSATLDRDLERFYAMHRSSDGPKGKFLHEEIAAFFSRFARAFDERGWLRLSWLEVGGEPYAGVLSFAARGTWDVYNSAYDHRRRELGPGMVLMAETLRLAIEEGCSTFDLLRGDEPYKYRFGAVDVPLIALSIRRD